MTFYRYKEFLMNPNLLLYFSVHMQDNSDNLYQPVTEERLRASIEQSKAMEYAGHEIIFF